MNPLDKHQVDASTPAKKAYSGPQLRVYGDLREITNTVGKTAHQDGGSGSTSMTRL